MRSMRQSATAPKLVLAWFGVALLAACSEGAGPDIPSASPDTRITVSNDAAALASRVQLAGGQPVDLDPSGLPASAQAAISAAPPVVATFQLFAQVTPPVVDGHVLEASHIYLDDDYAYVSYMVHGEAALGAVEVFNIKKPDSPVLVSQAILHGTDVASLSVDDHAVYLAAATDDTTFAERAVLEEISLKNGLLTSSTRRWGLPSYVATGVDVRDKRVYVTSGNGGPNQGGLTALDQKTLTPLSADAFPDARGVSAESKDYVTVVQGTPARLRIYSAKTGALVRTVALPGGTIPDSKSTVAATDEWAFVATGDGGMQVVDLASGRVAASMPQPVLAGVDPADAVTNAVSLSGDLVLTANGGAGLSVSYSDYDKAKSGSTPQLVALGRLALPGSVNFVASDKNTLFLATGTGGLAILGVTTR